METLIKNFSLITSVVLTGLSAGLFYAWSVSVIPGHKRVSVLNYLESMQEINRAIINPPFILIFFGSLILLALATVLHHQSGTPFYYMLGATLVYLVGTVAVTGFGNVPLNDMLDVAKLQEMNLDQLKELRASYEIKWNKLHTIRTVFAVLSFLLIFIAALKIYKS